MTSPRSESSQVEVLLGLAGIVAGYLLTMDVATRRRLYELELRLLDRLDEVEHARFGALPLQRLPDMIAILEHHAQSGVRTSALDKTSLPPELTRPLVLFDDALLLSHTDSSGGSSATPRRTSTG